MDFGVTFAVIVQDPAAAKLNPLREMVELVLTPGVPPVTFTSTVPAPPDTMLLAASETVPDPATAVMVPRVEPGVQALPAPLGPQILRMAEHPVRLIRVRQRLQFRLVQLHIQRRHRVVQMMRFARPHDRRRDPGLLQHPR
jgi:hypothetical protein